MIEKEYLIRYKSVSKETFMQMKMMLRITIVSNFKGRKTWEASTTRNSLSTLKKKAESLRMYRKEQSNDNKQIIFI